MSDETASEHPEAAESMTPMRVLVLGLAVTVAAVAGWAVIVGTDDASVPPEPAPAESAASPGSMSDFDAFDVATGSEPTVLAESEEPPTPAPGDSASRTEEKDLVLAASDDPFISVSVAFLISRDGL